MTPPPSTGTATAVRRSSVDRFAARSTRRRPTLRPGRRLLLVVFASLLLVAAGAYVVLLSPLLSVRTVAVSGLPAPAAAGLRQRADAVLGQPLARVDTRAVAARLLASDLDSVTVLRSYPHTLMVRAVPRVAVLATQNAQGQVEVWDRHGVLMGVVPAPPTGVPVLQAGSTALTPEGVTTLTTVLQSLAPAQRRQVSDVTVSAIGQVRLRLGGVEIVWGDASDSALKVRVVNALLSQAKSRIDVSAPRTPSVR